LVEKWGKKRHFDTNEELHLFIFRKRYGAEWMTLQRDDGATCQEDMLTWLLVDAGVLDHHFRDVSREGSEKNRVCPEGTLCALTMEG